MSIRTIGRSLILGVGFVLAVSACSGSGQSDASQGNEPGTQTSTVGPTSGPGGDVAKILAELNRGDAFLEQSDAAVALDATEALQEVAKRYDLTEITAQPPEVIQAVVSARQGSTFARGQQVYVIYLTGFERIEYGPVPQSGAPEEIVIAQAAFFVDANTGDFIKATWWE